MKQSSVGLLASLMSTAALSQSINFDGDPVGSVPPGWSCGVTGSGNPRWEVTTDPSAPSKPNVLKQTGRGTFPWCVKNGSPVADGFVEVKFKPMSGREDQAGGLVWRWKDGDNYYVARANALENNVSLYYTERGSRKSRRPFAPHAVPAARSDPPPATRATARSTGPAPRHVRTCRRRPVSIPVSSSCAHQTRSRGVRPRSPARGR